MAREVPGIQPTVGGLGQYSVGQRRAAAVPVPRSKALDLSDTINAFMGVAKSYGGLQKQQEQIGLEQAQLVEEQNVIAELKKQKDVDGFSPLATTNRDRAYRDSLLKRHINNTMLPSLQSKEAELVNAESYKDRATFLQGVDKTFQEEWNSLVSQVGEGVANSTAGKALWDYVTTPYKNKLALQYEEQKQQVIQQGLQDELTVNLTAATRDKGFDTSILADIAVNYEELFTESGVDKITRNKLLIDGYAGVVGQLHALDRYDDAEKVLDSIKTIRINGKPVFGSKEAVRQFTPLRDRIQAAQEASKRDEGDRSREITNLYMPAASAVLGGLSNDKDPARREQINQMQLDSVVEFLLDAGWDEAYASTRAQQLMQSQDVNALSLEGLKYRDNDKDKGAWNAATGSIQRFTIDLVAKSNAVMSRAEMQGALEEVEAELEMNPETNINELLASKKITDPRVKADAIALSREAKSNLWLEKTETYKNYERQFENDLNNAVEMDVLEGERRDDIKQAQESGRAAFQQEYINEIRKLQTSLKEAPDRDTKIVQEIPKVISKITDRWRDYKIVEKQFMEGRVKALEAGEIYEPPTIPELEEAQEDIESVLSSWLDDFGTQAEAFVQFDYPRKYEGERAVLAEEIPTTLEGRLQAFDKAEVVEKALLKEEYKDSTDLKEGLQVIREFYGFRHPREISSDMAVVLDFRYTPMYESSEMLIEDTVQAYKELKIYNESPESLDIEDFPMFNLYNTKFGISEEEHLKTFKEVQEKILRIKNR